MQPQTFDDNARGKAIRTLLILSAVLCLIGGIIFLQWWLQFRIVSTTPSMDTFPAGSPVLIIDFSQPLAKSSLTTTWSPAVSSTYAISGSQLTLNLQTSLQVDTRYHLTIHGITNQKGTAFGDVTYAFTAKDIAYNDMPAVVQHALLQQQDHTQAVSRNSIIFSNTDALLNQGLSSLQLEAVKQAVFLFGQSQTKVFSTAVIDPDSVQAGPHDPESDSVNFSITCTITLDKKAYAATITYHDLNNAQLVLSDPASNSQVYDSGDLDGSTL